MTLLPPQIILLQPPRIVFGNGAARTCGADVVARGLKRVAVLATARASQHLAGLREEFAHAKTEIIPITNLPPEPTVADFERIRSEVGAVKLDGVIGCGGGSVLDVAKLLAVLAGRKDPVSAFFGTGLLPARKIHLACIPTTSGSGSEVSPNAILLDEAARLKKGVIGPQLVPDAAYIDPLLLVTAPAALTAATGLDALVHCIEAYANLHSHPLVDAYALEGIRLIAANLPVAVANPGDLGARAALAQGSLYGGLCLGPVNTAAVHALAYPLGSVFHVAHGLANALLLPHVLRFNLPAAPARYADIARALGASDSSGSDEALAEAGLRRIEDLMQQCRLPRGLRACGVTEQDIPALVSGALQVTRLLRNNVREVTGPDAEAIFRSAL
ncbi:alcohol dehydrogenase [Opitutaceae bacterium EW11]|nr:alcohol dehydrogenase [Opitutaceae bacterium EW11]